MRLSIGGLEIRPWVWRKAFEEGGGYDSDAAEDRAAGVALGYVAQVKRLGVPRPGKEHACTACLLSSRPLARLGHDCGMPLWDPPPPPPPPFPLVPDLPLLVLSCRWLSGWAATWAWCCATRWCCEARARLWLTASRRRACGECENCASLHVGVCQAEEGTGLRDCEDNDARYVCHSVALPAAAQLASASQGGGAG